MYIFASGSCRILTTLNYAILAFSKEKSNIIIEKIHPIHTYENKKIITKDNNIHESENGYINFLGLMYNTRQHIQFLKFIKDEIKLPDSILYKFIRHNSHEEIQHRKNTIRKYFNDCEWYIFEISSLKLYSSPVNLLEIAENTFTRIKTILTNSATTNYDNLNKSDLDKEMHEIYNHINTKIIYEINTDVIGLDHQPTAILTEDELLTDLHTIRSLIPKNKKILFQTHFRPQIIRHNDNLIENREIIYNTVNKFCESNENTYIYDPSILLKTNLEYIREDNEHFTVKGYYASMNYIYDTYLSKY
jgi:hypothetical protein